MHWRSRFRRSWKLLWIFCVKLFSVKILPWIIVFAKRNHSKCSPRSKKNRSSFYEQSALCFVPVICVILLHSKPFAFLELVFLQFKGNSVNRWQTSALLKKTATFLLVIKVTAKFYFHHLLLQVVKNSQDLGHRQILDAQTYGNAKELATDYQKTKSMLYKRLQETGYGSWDLMKKPPELSHFN